MPGPRRESCEIVVKGLLLLERIVQDLDTRTSKIFTQGPLSEGLTTVPQDLLTRNCTRSCKTLLDSTSPGSSQDLLTSACARLCKDLLKDVSGIFKTSSHKDLYKTLVKFVIEGPSGEFIRSLYQNLRESANISTRAQESDQTCTKCRDVWASEIKFAPRHNESDLTHTQNITHITKIETWKYQNRCFT